MLIKIVQEAVRLGIRYGKPIARGLATYEKPLFQRAYKGYPRWYSKKAYNYYRASTVTTIVKPGVDYYLDALTQTDGSETDSNRETRNNVVSTRRKRFNGQKRRIDRYCKRRARFRK